MWSDRLWSKSISQSMMSKSRTFRAVPILLILVGIFAALSAVAVGLPSAKGPSGVAQFSKTRKCKRAQRRKRGSRRTRKHGCSGKHSGKRGKHCKRRRHRSRKRCQRKQPPGKKGGSGKAEPKSTEPPPAPSPAQPRPAPAQSGPASEPPPPDVTPPDTGIDSGPPEGATLYEGSASFTFSSPDDGAATFECSLDSAVFSACQSPVDYAGLATGNHSFKVRAVDAAGNRDPSPASRGFKVDLTRADTTITAHPPQTVVPDSTQELRFESDDPGSTFECRLDTSAFAPCSSPWSISVNAPGDYSGEVRAIGSNGQPDPTPAGFTLHAAEPEERCGTLAHDETWSTDNLSGIVLTCSVNVPAGIKLEIDAGVFVKSSGGAIEVTSGALEANGTAAEPVAFTSWADDSVGGAVSGDLHGATPSAPAAGDWPGIRATGGATVNLQHAAVDYADTGLQDEADDVHVADSSFRHSAASAVLLVNDKGLDGLMDAGNSAASSGQVDGIEARCLTLGEDGTITTRSDWQFEIAGNGCGTFNVPAGKKLTVSPGSVVKSNGVQIEVQGGALEANGTAAEPVAFTSWADDSVGGAVSGDLHGATPSAPAAGDWPGIRATGGATVNLQHAAVDYADTGLQFEGEGAALNATTLTSNEVALRVNAGSVTFRGVISGNEEGIRACAWGADCSVDASYTYWGSAEGPFPAGGDALACGAVTVDPYLVSEGGGTSEIGGIVFGAGNCDGSSPPWDTLTAGQAVFNEGVANASSLCAELGDDVCEAINTAFACLSGAYDLGASQLAFPLPNPYSGGISASGWETNATTAASNAANWLSTSADSDVAVFGKVVSRGLQIVGLANTFNALSDAYASCAP